MNYNDVSQWAADLGSGYSRIYPLGEGGRLYVEQDGKKF